ncbi:MAG: hypothetical protein COB63_05545, partial [Candidatus Pelagibacter sp.]
WILSQLSDAELGDFMEEFIKRHFPFDSLSRVHPEGATVYPSREPAPTAQPTHSGSLILFDASLTLARVRNVASPLVFCRFFPIL